LGVSQDTIKALVDVAFVLLTSRARRERYPGYVCSVKKGEVAWYVLFYIFHPPVVGLL
jgi:telomerase reverse transcriptase